MSDRSGMPFNHSSVICNLISVTQPILYVQQMMLVVFCISQKRRRKLLNIYFLVLMS